MPDAITTAAVAPELLFRQLAGRLQKAMEHGSLGAGDRLPSVRELARREQVSLATAVSCYRHLENLGLVEARPKSGYYVRARPPRLAEPEMQTAQGRASRVSVNNSVMSILAAMRQPGIIPLGAACPGPALYPSARLRRLLAAQTSANLESIGRYGTGMGHPALRSQLVRRYAHVDVLLDAEEIIVTIGAMEALYLALQAVARPGDTIAIESPTYFGILQIIENLGLKALEIPTSPRDGLSLEALDLATQRPGAVQALVVMPTVQNPLGAIMPEDRRERLVTMMAERGIAVIEDDIYGELPYGRPRPRPLKSWDRTGNVMLCGSFTKVLAPGFRVGYLVAGRWREQIEHLKFVHTVSTPEVLQAAIAAFMESGGYDHHLRHLREAFHSQLGMATATVERHFPPGTRLSRPGGGFLLWVELPRGLNGLALFERALAENIYIVPGSIFSGSHRFDHCLRINCGYPWSVEIEQALVTLGRLCHEMLAGAD
ncbi:MAG: PLP-dependent aminotransferase family protein [Perlucidibaca sp.]